MNEIYDARCLFWVWFALVLFCALAILGGIIGWQTWKDLRYFKRAERNLSRRL